MATEVSPRFLNYPSEFTHHVKTILGQAVEVESAVCGLLQIYSSEKRGLVILAHCGLPKQFLDLFETVKATDSCVCARAFRYAAQTTVYDINSDRDFLPYLDKLGDIPFTSIQATPILDTGGVVIGILTTHFGEPKELRKASLRTLTLLAEALRGPIEQYCADIRSVYI